MRDLIDINDLSHDELISVLRLGMDIARNPMDFSDSARGRILATLFFEPSTRTRLSFESAMLGLGGGVIGFSDPASSSSAKGETVADTVRAVSCYSSVIVMRNPLEGAAMLGAMYATVPVINAGDGGHSHPTQTLTDLLTLIREKGGIDGLHVGMCGDLKNSRTVHSLINALACFRDVKITLISPAELCIPDYMKQGALKTMRFCETESLTAALPNLDVLYMTRVQKERFNDPAQYQRLKDHYILDMPKMALARKDATIMHPLPRVNEITPDVDDDPRAAYFRQVQCGRYVRMALISSLVLGHLSEQRPLYDSDNARHDMRCANDRCISNHMPGAKHVFVPRGDGGWKCVYCEK